MPNPTTPAQEDIPPEEEHSFRLMLRIYRSVMVLSIAAIIGALCLVFIVFKVYHYPRVHHLHLPVLTVARTERLPDGSWRFVVSGDSRNCGDLVVPTIAAHSAQFAPGFYWHLGDLRAIYKIDEDMAFAAAKQNEVLTCDNYHRLAWSDFVTNQIASFGHVPFYLGIGNHEVIPPKNEDMFKEEFADWLDLPVLKEQRAKDKTPAGPQTYYHWIQGGVDFIYLDNAANHFSRTQLDWLKKVLASDSPTTNSEVKSIVVGMHEALPDSLGNSHSMGDDRGGPEGRATGKEAYDALEAFRDHAFNADKSPKPVYVLASHSHFYMENIYDTDELTDHHKKQPLPGWIVGTAGAVRYALPDNPPKTAKTDVYGYLLGTVAASGTIQFDFKEVQEWDVPEVVRQRYPEAFLPWCFARNSQNKEPKAVDITPRCPVDDKTSAPKGKEAH